MTSADPTVGEILQQVQLELYRDHVQGSRDVLDRARARHDDPALERERTRIGSWLSHMDSRAACVDAHCHAGSRGGFTPELGSFFAALSQPR